MTVIHALEGAPQPFSMSVGAKVTGTTQNLLYADNVGLINAASIPATVLATGRVRFDLTGLLPGTRYWWAVQDDGVVDEAWRGTFKTAPAPGTRGSYTFVVGGCAGAEPEFPGVASSLVPSRTSQHPVFETIRARGLARDWLFMVHLGDIHYYDLGEAGLHGVVGGNSLDNNLRAHDDVMQNQGHTYATLPLVYSAGGGGHDWGQPIGLARTLPGGGNVLRAWRQVYPDFTPEETASDGASYRSFEVDGILYIVTDENAGRDPDEDVEGPSKTKLGATQKAWFRRTLEESDAEALIWISGAQWERGGSGNWGRYTTERSEMIGILADTGYLNRMVFITGDRHALEIVKAENNPYGGFPIWHFASLDSPPADLTTPPGSLGNNRYGTVTVTYTPGALTITGTGWIGTDAWDSDTLVLDIQDIDPEPETPPVVGVPTITPKIEWFACDIVTGRKIARLPGVTGTISRALGAYAQGTLTIPVPLHGMLAIGSLAYEVTEPRRTMIVAVINGVPQWAGQVICPEDSSEGDVTFAVASLEAYLLHRYVPDLRYTQRDQTSVILNGLVSTAQDEGINLILDTPASGVLRDREYRDTDDATVYDRLTELMDVQGGPEWTIDLDWDDAVKQQAVTKIFRARPHIGLEDPKVTLSTLGQTKARYKVRRDYSAGKFANDIMATSSGEGDARPQSVRVRATDQIASGMPRHEYRFSPGSNIKDIPTLNEHAIAMMQAIGDGVTSVATSVRIHVDPPMGIGWNLGDVVNLNLFGPMRPNGFVTTARIVGWSLDTVTGRADLTVRV